MNVFVFGNRDYGPDAAVLSLVPRLRTDFPAITFHTVNPNADLPAGFAGRVIILDVVEGIKKVTLITEDNAETIVSPPRFGVHDYDLGFQLKYLSKLGKLTNFTIIGVPMNEALDYDSIQVTLRKLVAQDIQGS